MKKIIILLVFFVCMFTACNNESTDPINGPEASIFGGELYTNRDVFSFEDKEQAVKYWDIWVDNDTAPDNEVMEFFIDENQGALGTITSAKIIIKQSNIEAQLFTKLNESVNATLQSFKTYVFSFWIKSDDFTTLNAAEISFLDDNGVFKNYAWINPVRNIKKEWTYISSTFKTDDLSLLFTDGVVDNAYVQFKFYNNDPNELNLEGIYYIDEISLTELKI